MSKTKVAIIGSGNIGTDLMIKVLRTRTAPRDGRDGRHRPRLRRPRPRRAAGRARPPTKASTGLIALPDFDDIDIVFDATSAKAHEANAAKLAPARQAPDRPHPGRHRPLRHPRGQPRRPPRRTRTSTWSPAAARPPSRSWPPSPASSRRLRRDRRVDRLASPPGPGTRANIDEFTETTSAAIDAGRRRPARQGDHHPQPRRAAADHARHRLRARQRPRRRHPRADRRLGGEDGRRRRGLRPRLPAQAEGADHRRSPTTSRSRRSSTPAPSAPPTRCRCSSRSRAPRTTCPRTPATSTS